MVSGGPAEVPAISDDKIVWMFGTRRTGSTWLGFMLRELPGGAKWGEPLIGELIGGFYERFSDRTAPNFIFSPEHRDLWLGWIQRLVCEGAAARFPRLIDGDGFVVIREPHGTLGAPLLCEALPRSRVLVLVRDPRDVIASITDAHTEGAWLGEKAKQRGRVPRAEGEHVARRDPVGFARTRAERITREFAAAREAYEAHSGPKVLTRYEDLRADTFSELRRICTELELPGDDDEIRAAVDAHAWENVPEEEKGSGKFHRKATPGGWREDLVAEQVEAVEKAAAEVLDEYYPDWRAPAAVEASS